MTVYTIDQTIPSTYISKRGTAVNGYLVYFTINEFGETHQVYVETLNPQTVDGAIKEIIKQRKSLADLGKG